MFQLSKASVITDLNVSVLSFHGFYYGCDNIPVILFVRDTFPFSDIKKTLMRLVWLQLPD